MARKRIGTILVIVHMLHSRKLDTLLSFNLDGTPDKAYKLPVPVFTFNKQDLIWPELYT